MSAIGFIKKRCRAFSLGRAKASREESSKPAVPDIFFMTPTSSIFDRSSDGTVIGRTEGAQLSMVFGNSDKKLATDAEDVQYNDPRMQANYNAWRRDRDNIILDKKTKRALVHQKFQANMVNLCAEYSQQITDIEDRTSDRLTALTFQHAQDVARCQQPLSRKRALLDPKYSYIPQGRGVSTEYGRPRTPASASSAQASFCQQQYHQYQHQSQLYPESARTYSDTYSPDMDPTRQSQIVEITDEEYAASQNHGFTASSSNATIRPINARRIKPTIGSPPPPPPAPLSSHRLSTKASNISSWSYHASPPQMNQAYQHYPRSIISIQRPHTSGDYAYSAYSQSGYAASEYNIAQKSVSRVSRTSRNIRADQFGQKV